MFSSKKGYLAILAFRNDHPPRKMVWWLKDINTIIGFSSWYDINLAKNTPKYLTEGIAPFTQARISYDKDENAFFIEHGNCKIFVDGKETSGRKERLNKGSVISFGEYGFDCVFYPNECMIVDFEEMSHCLHMKDSIVIGREGDIKVSPELKFYVSERHCAIQFDFRKNKFFIRDLGSANGTFVNGKKIWKFPRKYLKDGDKIQFAPEKYGFKGYFLFEENFKGILNENQLSHNSPVKERLKQERKELNDLENKFVPGVEEIFNKHGFKERAKDVQKTSLEDINKWRAGSSIGFTNFGKGGDTLILCYPAFNNLKSPIYHGSVDLDSPICQRCFKIFINPTAEGFLEVFDRTLQILDKNLYQFRAKIIPNALRFKTNPCEEIIIYSPLKKENINKSPEYSHEEALRLVSILKEGLADFEKYADPQRSRSYYSKRITGLIYYRQGGSYHRNSSGTFNNNLHLFEGENFHLFNLKMINQISAVNEQQNSPR